MSNHKIGGHVLGSQRDGWGNIAPQMVTVVAVGNAGAFDECAPECIKIYRDQSHPDHVDAPGDFDQLPDAQLFAAGEYWFGQLWPRVRAVMLQYQNVYWQPTNEINNPRIVEYLRGFMAAADRIGVKLALFGDAGDSPQWAEWERHWVPLLREAAAEGHIYSRHVYAGVHPQSTADLLTNGNGQPHDPMTARPFREAEFLREQGIYIPMVISELGWNGGYRDQPSWWIDDLMRYNKLMVAEPLIVGAALWTWGNWPGKEPSNLGGAQTADLANALAGYDPQWWLAVKPPPEPTPEPQTLDEAMIAYADGMHQSGKLMSLNINAALQKALGAAGALPVAAEGRLTHGGKNYAVQVGRFWDNDDVLVAHTEVGDWGSVETTPGKLADGKIVFAGEQPVPPPEPDGFKFEFWPTQHKTITQPFGANPAYYLQFGLPGHEGVDIRAPHGSPIVAVADGRVSRVGDDRQSAANGGHNYGVRVYLQHESGYETIYAHLDRRAVNVGQTVTAGQLIGHADNTGNSSGSHLHLTLKRAGATVAGHTRYPHDIVDPTPYLRDDLPIAPIPPAVGATYNISDYFWGVNERVQWVLRAANGSQEDLQMVASERRLIKNDQGNMETFTLGSIGGRAVICRDLDTSPGGGRYYTQRVGSSPAPWVPARMALNERFLRQPMVQFFDRATCRPITDATLDPSYIRLVAHYPKFDNRQWTGRSDLPHIVLDDCLLLQWERLDGVALEQYVISRELGYFVGWRRLHQDVHTPPWSVIVEINQGRPPLRRPAGSCW